MQPTNIRPEAERARRSLAGDPPEEPAPLLSWPDLLHLLFRHKWKLLTLAGAGFAAALAFWLIVPAPHASEAKIMIRYVLESKAQPTVNQGPNETQISNPDLRGESIINSEIEVLTSRDLAEQVAADIGPARILGDKKPGADPLVAAGAVIVANLTVEVPKKSKIIKLTFQHSHPEIARLVLESLTTNYLRKHIEIHRALGLYDEFFTTKTDQLRNELADLENQIRTLKAKFGVVSFDEAKKALANQIARVSEEQLAIETELAAQRAVGGLLSPDDPKTVTGPGSNTIPSRAPAPMETGLEAGKYRELCARLVFLEKRELELSSVYTDENTVMKNLRGQIEQLREQKAALEKEHPGLLSSPSPPARDGPSLGGSADWGKAASLQAKLETLTNQLAKLRTEAGVLDEADTQHQDLIRRKEIHEINLRQYNASLEQSRIDKTLGPGSVSNISIVQAATPAEVVLAGKLKISAGLLVLGIGAGLLWAFVVEYLLFPVITRPADFKTRLKLPLFLWVPLLSRSPLPSGRAFDASPAADAKDARAPGLDAVSTEYPLLQPGTAPWDQDHEMRSYYEALRDRLMTHFEIKNMTHKPKLVAVTSCSKGSGVTSLATGLAALFSETGDGNVLLVDMSLDRGAAHPFFRGRPGCGLAQVLDQSGRQEAMVQDHLFVASVNDLTGKVHGLVPIKFKHLMPRMKASDFDYIIFDMPPISQTSITPRLAASMDINLLVVEAEKDSPAKVREVMELLEPSRAPIGGVLNKRRFYLPRQLESGL